MKFVKAKRSSRSCSWLKKWKNPTKNTTWALSVDMRQHTLMQNSWLRWKNFIFWTEKAGAYSNNLELYPFAWRYIFLCLNRESKRRKFWICWFENSCYYEFALSEYDRRKGKTRFNKSFKIYWIYDSSFKSRISWAFWLIQEVFHSMV